VPTVAGSEINDDPYNPVSKHARDLVAERATRRPSAGCNRSQRYGEKLATPDTSIADVIGEVDPIKVAEGRYLSDELTIHYGLVPRSNRGNLRHQRAPHLAERIQVGLLDVLEERDVQIRGHKVRLPLDVMFVASANPEDYTNRGRIITPLKDRFGARVRTHYPIDVATELAIIEAEARPLAGLGIRVDVPAFMTEIVARLSQLARRSPRREPALWRLGTAQHRQLRDARGGSRSPGGPGRGERSRRPRERSRRSLVLDARQARDRIAGGREDEEIVERLMKTAVLQVFRDCADRAP